MEHNVAKCNNSCTSKFFILILFQVAPVIHRFYDVNQEYWHSISDNDSIANQSGSDRSNSSNDASDNDSDDSDVDNTFHKIRSIGNQRRKTKQELNNFHKTRSKIIFESDTDDGRQPTKPPRRHRSKQTSKVEILESPTKTITSNKTAEAEEKRRSWTDSGVSFTRTDQSRNGTINADPPIPASLLARSKMVSEVNRNGDLGNNFPALSKVSVPSAPNGSEKTQMLLAKISRLLDTSDNPSSLFSTAPMDSEDRGFLQNTLTKEIFSEPSKLPTRPKLPAATEMYESSGHVSPRSFEFGRSLTALNKEGINHIETAKKEEGQSVIREKSFHDKLASAMLRLPSKQKISSNVTVSSNTEKRNQVSLAKEKEILEEIVRNAEATESTLFSSKNTHELDNTSLKKANRSQSFAAGWKKVKESIRPRFFSEKQSTDCSSEFSFTKYDGQSESNSNFSDRSSLCSNTDGTLSHASTLKVYDADGSEDHEDNLDRFSKKPNTKKMFKLNIFKKAHSFSTEKLASKLRRKGNDIGRSEVSIQSIPANLTRKKGEKSSDRRPRSSSYTYTPRAKDNYEEETGTITREKDGYHSDTDTLKGSNSKVKMANTSKNVTNPYLQWPNHVDTSQCNLNQSSRRKSKSRSLEDLSHKFESTHHTDRITTQVPESALSTPLTVRSEPITCCRAPNQISDDLFLDDNNCECDQCLYREYLEFKKFRLSRKALVSRNCHGNNCFNNSTSVQPSNFPADRHFQKCVRNQNYSNDFRLATPQSQDPLFESNHCFGGSFNNEKYRPKPLAVAHTHFQGKHPHNMFAPHQSNRHRSYSTDSHSSFNAHASNDEHIDRQSEISKDIFFDTFV